MRFQIEHESAYRYRQPVFLEPQMLRLMPRNDGRQRVHEFHLDIQPRPVGLSHRVDFVGNAVAVAWFHDVTDHFRVNLRMSVETLGDNPFDFLLDADSIALPPAFSRPEEQPFAQLYLQRDPEDDPQGLVAEFACSLAEQVDHQTVPFLTGLNLAIHERIPARIREEGAAQPAAHTLTTQSGACRDLAMLFVDAARVLGVPSRFVSGYQRAELDDNGTQHLHAWAEVYLPGSGWQGFDPTLGLSVAAMHVAVAAGPDPTSAAPITGAYRGAGVQAVFESRLDVRDQPTDPPDRPSRLQLG